MTLRLVPALLAALGLMLSPAMAQMGGPGGPPPAVGVVPVRQQAVTESSEFVGRVQAIDRVDLTARVTAFVEERLFKEGTEVKQGDLLYRLERAPFEAAVQQQSAAVANLTALLQNATTTLGRAQALLNTPAGQRSTYDEARFQQMSQAAQLAAAQAQLKVAQINLAYTEIRAPVAGKIGQTRFTPGNVVSPSSGALDTIVSQDPMYVEFPIAARAQLELEKRYADRGGLSAVEVKLRLADGSTYGPVGKIGFVAPTIAQTTDTITLRATIPNPPRKPPVAGEPVDRPLIDGMFVTVLVEGIEPVQALAIPRSAILSDQQGSYVYVVNDRNVAEQRRVTLGQSTPTVAVIASGLKEGEKVVVDGIQRVRPGQPVTPGPANPATPGLPKAAAANAPPAGASASGPRTTAASSPANPTPTSGAPAASSGGGSAQH
jgi:membrane fusion protein (multidrug efflux system)